MSIQLLNPMRFKGLCGYQICRTKSFWIGPMVYLKIYTANEGSVRIQSKCHVQIYVFPEMKLHGLVISKTEL
jgi:hypothetical protein